MLSLHSFLVTAHIAIGSVALLLFWVPVLAKKGGTTHVNVGRIYVFVMYAVAFTAFVASIIVLYDPVGIRRPGEQYGPEQTAALSQGFRMFSLFLLMLSVLVYSALTHGLAALKERRNPGQWRSRSHLTMLAILGLLGVAVGIIGFRYGQWLLVIFAGISVSASINMFREVRRPKMTQGELVAAHLNGLIGSGIGAYTAFFAFGGSRFFAELLPGQWQIIPWVLPSIIGTIAIARISRRYRPRKAATTA